MPKTIPWLPRRASFAAIFVLAAAAILAACGGDGEDSSKDEGTKPSVAATEPAAGQPTEAPDGGGGVSGGLDIDACALITKDEAEAVLGVPVGEPEQFPTDVSVDCTYQGEGFEQVGVFVLAYRNAEEALATEKNAAQQNGYPVIEGLGDFAYDSSPFFTLTFIKGRYAVSIDVVLPNSDDEAEFESARDLAGTVLDRLP